MHPLVLPKFCVKSTQLEVFQLQREPRPDLLQPCSFIAFEHVPMMSKEKEVPLVVEGHYPSSFELGNLGEQRCKKASNPVAEPCGEIIEDELRLMIRWPSVIEHLLGQCNA